MGLQKATSMKIFEKFFIDSQRLEELNKNKIFLKINQRFSKTESHILDEDWMDLYGSL
jgi:hypothetical protein